MRGTPRHATVRRRARAAGCAVLLLLTTVATGEAAAAPPTKPSAAAQLAVGIPYSSTIDRDVAAQEWLKLPQYMRPGDSLTLASDSSRSSIRYCLVPVIDDFDAADTATACDGPGYPSEFDHADVSSGMYRRTIEWSRQAGPGMLLVAPGCGFCGADVWTYSVTIEQVITRVNIGTARLERSPRNVALTASATFGDNTPAADGIAGQLLWRIGSSDDLQPLAQATTAGGQLAFGGTLPQEAAGKTVELSACVNQVGGGDPRCTAQSVKVDPDPIPTLITSRLKMNRRRVILAPVTCAAVFAPNGCRGTLELTTRRSLSFRGRSGLVRLARQRFAIPAGQTTRIAVRLGKQQARLVRKVRRARAAKATIRLDGQPGRATRNVSLGL
jgi:hypothetical protein